MVNYVNLGGAKRPVKFGMVAFRHIEKKTGDAYQVLMDKAAKGSLSMTEVTILIEAALVGGAKIKGQDIEFNDEDVAIWLDEAEGDALGSIMDALFESQPVPEKGEKGNVKAGTTKQK